MNQPIRDLELVELIGEGRYGSVYRATHAEFGECSVRIFRPAAVNRRVLAFALQKAITIPAHPALMRVHSLDLASSPGNCVGELVGEPTEDGWKVTTLADRAGKIPEKDCWNLLYEIAGALDHLHKFGIAHCDVAARNTMFHRDAEGELVIKVGGYGMGLMADVPELNLGMEVLRLAPEQLLRPEGIYEGAAFGWDVYSFGILAYRILTGRYPRGEAFWNQHYANGEEGIRLDVKGLVAAVQADVEIAWPASSNAVGIRRCRQVVEQCLALDPTDRPVDLREVRERFDQVRHSIETQTLRAEAEKAKAHLGEAKGEVERIKMETASLNQKRDTDLESAKLAAAEAAKAELIKQSQAKIEETRTAALAEAKEGEKKLRADAEAAVIAARNQAAQQVAEERDRIGTKMRIYKWGAIAGIVGCSALVALTLKFWRQVERSGVSAGDIEELQGELSRAESKVSSLSSSLAEEKSAKESAEERARVAEESSAKAIEEIENLVTQFVGTDEGMAKLSNTQLETVLGNYEAMLENPAFQAPELARANKLYEVARLRQRLEKEGVLEAYSEAGKIFFEWLNGAVDHPDRLKVLRRLARCEDESYKLHAQAGNAEEAIKSLRACTGVYDSILDETPDDGEVVLGSARTHFSLGQYLRFQLRNDEAIEAQSRVVDALADIDSAFKDPKTLREGQFLRARSRHETGLIERQRAEFEKAIAEQLDAVEQLIPLVHSDQALPSFSLRLAECYTELGELIAHHKNFQDGRGAHDEGVRLLLVILNKDLANDTARSLLARNYGELAWIDREEGNLKTALARLDAAITIFREMVRRIPGVREYVYRLAYYQRLKSEVLAEQKEKEQSVTLAAEAVGALEQLVEGTPATAPAEKQLYRIGLAHAYTSLGYANAEAGKDAPAKDYFTKAVTLWTELAEANPKNKQIAERLEVSARELKQFD